MFAKSRVRIFLLILNLIMRWNISQATYQALIVLYNSQEDFYSPIDRHTFNQYKPEHLFKILSACPAEQQCDDDFNTPRSATVEGISYDDLPSMRCELPFLPSPVGSSGVGYYFERRILEEAKIPIPSTSTDASPEIFPVTIYEIDVDKEKLHTTRTKHRIISYEYFVASASTETCQDFGPEIENVFKENEEIRQYYTDKYQQKYRNNRDENQRLVAAQLTPIGDFTDEASRKATCTLYNTVPLWSTVAEGTLRKLEIFIRHVADKLHVNALEVTTITHETLRLPKPRVQRDLTTISRLLSFSDNPILERDIDDIAHEPDTGEFEDAYLDPDNFRLPVPKILAKVLHYRVSVPISGGNVEPNPRKYRHYYIVFVIHNELDVSTIERICEIDVCRMYGWFVVRRSESVRSKTGFYCCTIHDSKLKPAFKLEYEGEPFDLNSVPIELDEDGNVVAKMIIPPLEER